MKSTRKEMSPILLYLIGLIAIPCCFAQDYFDKATAECYLKNKGTVHVRNCEQKLVNDKYFDKQWVLVPGPFEEFNNKTTVDLGIIDVWITYGYLGQNVKVSIQDDGLENEHPELEKRYNRKLSYNYCGNDANPMQYGNDTHGTSVAGIIAMEMNNGICGVGIAPLVKIVASRVHSPEKLTTKLIIVMEALKAYGIDITVSAMSGLPFEKLLVPTDLVLAMKDSVEKGRGGLGTVHIFSAGNVGQTGNTCSFDGYNQNIYTITVAAVTPWGSPTTYSGRCSTVMVSAPSSPPRLYETDKNHFLTIKTNKRCTLDFGGVSAATPVVGGILALAMSANRNMTWRDWHHAIVKTSSPAQLSLECHQFYEINGAGIPTSIHFGFGLINALKLVQAALNFEHVPPLQFYRHIINSTNDLFGPPSVLVEKVPIYKPNNVYYVEHVQLKLKFTFHNYAELFISLKSPSGFTSILLEPQTYDYYGNRSRDHFWTFDTVQFWGESTIGDWYITIKPRTFGQYRGSINRWELLFFGTATKPFYPFEYMN